jgi:hypothetical protein
MPQAASPARLEALNALEFSIFLRLFERSRGERMRKLDLLYAEFLCAGMPVLRVALNSRDWQWIDAEYEILHNVPSLIGETNIERHKYFWFGERTHHMEWASAPGREEAHSRMLAYYKPIWDKMEPLIMKLVSDTGRQQ